MRNLGRLHPVLPVGGTGHQDEGVRTTKAPVTWLRSYWNEEEITYYFEVDEDGWVPRQVELQGPQRIPQAAASLAEWPDADSEGVAAVQRYETRYGALADQPIGSWDPDFPHESISADTFQDIWSLARATLER